jgi:hypothetical protein
MRARTVYDGSDGELTKRYYGELFTHGPLGVIAVNLFRAQKCSARAKRYRGGVRGVGSYRSMAYERKNYSIEQLCEALKDHAKALGMKWGWKRDPLTPGYEWVLYIDLPNGQVSFHSSGRGMGPEYPGEWDHERKSADRIIAFCDWVSGEDAPVMAPSVEPVGGQQTMGLFE